MPNDPLLAGFRSSSELLHRSEAPVHLWRLHLANLKAARAVCQHLADELDKLIGLAEVKVAEHDALQQSIAEFERTICGKATHASR